MRNKNNPSAGKSRASLFVSRFVAYTVLILFSLLTLFWFYILVVNATRSHPDIQKGFSMIPGGMAVANFKAMLADKAVTPILTGIRNSLFVSGFVAVLSCYFSALTAFALHVYNFRLKKAATAFIMAVMVIPTQVSVSGFLQLIGVMKLTDSFVPLILPSIASPVVFFFMRQYMQANLPLEVVEAARIDGAGEFFTFNRIVLPIMKPAMAVQAIITFIGAWNNYFVPALVLESADKKTVPILIASLRSADFVKFNMGQLYMTIAVAVIPIIIVYLILSKYIVQGVAMGSVKG